MSLLAWLNPYRWLLALALGAALVIGLPIAKHYYDEARRDEGRTQIRDQMKDAALRELQHKAAEGLRRLEAQDANQRAQDAEVARLRDAAARNAADADRVRQQSTAAAREWAARLADSPTAQDVQAAGAAIAVCTDVRGRLDAAAGELAAYAGAARTAGLKCEADYDSLSQHPQP